MPFVSVFAVDVSSASEGGSEDESELSDSCSSRGDHNGYFCRHCYTNSKSPVK